jgi:hypothetical protein
VDDDVSNATVDLVDAVCERVATRSKWISGSGAVSHSVCTMFSLSLDVVAPLAIQLPSKQMLDAMDKSGQGFATATYISKISRSR